MHATWLPAETHALRFDGPICNIHEAPVLGNGDLAAMVRAMPHEFRLELGKQDIFDARHETLAAEVALPQAELIRLSRDYGFRWEAYAADPEFDREPEGYTPPRHGMAGLTGPSPCPKPAGAIVIAHSGLSDTRIDTVLDIARGVLRTSYRYDYGWHGTAALHIEAFVARAANVVHLRIWTEGLVGQLHLLLEKLPDRLDPSIPLPETAAGGRRAAVIQRIPAGCDVPEFAWTLAADFAAPAPGVAAREAEALVWQTRQRVTLEPGAALTIAVAVATDRDPGGRAQAGALLEAAPAYDAARAAQEAAWAAFWRRSGIALADAPLELAWYRNLYAHACHIPAGDAAQAPGLCANVPVDDSAPWHGVYTVNMNIQKMFLPAVWTNHPEWIDNYLGWLERLTPTFAYLCELIFGFPGIYSEHMLYPQWVPPHRANIANTCGRALCMVGWHGQPLWWRWQTTRDRAFLARAYRYFARAADFYADYFDRFMADDNVIYPSVNLEGPLTRDFAANRDCATDLIIIPQALQWAITAAEALGVDAEKRARWQAAQARIHPLRYGWLPDGRGAIADHGEELAAGDEAMVPWTIFPGEYVDGDEPDGLAAVVRDLMIRTGWQTRHPRIVWMHHWWCAIPALRLGLPGAFENARAIILKEQFSAGHARTTHWINLQPDAWRCPEDNYLGVAAVTEMLLQSQGEVLRLFPAWPREQAARFFGLPARGGFLVSAAWHPQDGLRAEITSLAGLPCRLRGARPEVTCGGAPVAVRPQGEDWAFATEAGRCYTLVRA